MIDELKLFRGQDCEISDRIVIHQPTISQICEYGETKYYSMITTLCATPSDLKVQLWDSNETDYERVDEFDLFCILSHQYTSADTDIIFDNVDFQNLDIATNEQNGETTLQDKDGNVIFDKSIYVLATTYLRSVHGFEKHVDKAANERTKKRLIDSERRRLLRHQNDKQQSSLVPLVSSMVNCEQFKYNHKTVWDLPIYAFMDSVKRIQKLKSYNQVMQGVYAGTIDMKTISEDSLNWMGSLSQR